MEGDGLAVPSRSPAATGTHPCHWYTRTSRTFFFCTQTYLRQEGGLVIVFYEDFVVEQTQQFAFSKKAVFSRTKVEYYFGFAAGTEAEARQQNNSMRRRRSSCERQRRNANGIPMGCVLSEAYFLKAFHRLFIYSLGAVNQCSAPF